MSYRDGVFFTPLHPLSSLCQSFPSSCPVSLPPHSIQMTLPPLSHLITSAHCESPPPPSPPFLSQSNMSCLSQGSVSYRDRGSPTSSLDLQSNHLIFTSFRSFFFFLSLKNPVLFIKPTPNQQSTLTSVVCGTTSAATLFQQSGFFFVFLSSSQTSVHICSCLHTGQSVRFRSRSAL